MRNDPGVEKEQTRRMAKKRSPQHRIFRLDKFPMDLGRFFLMALIPYYRIKKIYLGDPENVKAIKDGALLAANHSGFSDPLVLETAFWYRRVHYVVGEIAMEGRVKSALMRGAGCVRIDRNIADLQAIKQCVQILKDGYLLEIFPQGAVSEETAGFKSGAVLIAIQADVPIIPMFIIQRKHFWQRYRLVIGDPFYWRDHTEKARPSLKEIEGMTEILEREYEACRTWKSKRN